MVEGGDIAIGAVRRDDLSHVLTMVHRAGFGNVTRVLDPKRGAVDGQLRRASIATPVPFASFGDQLVALVINATARTAAAIDLLTRAGAEATWVSSRLGTVAPPTFGELSGRSREQATTDD